MSLNGGLKFVIVLAIVLGVCIVMYGIYKGKFYVQTVVENRERENDELEDEFKYKLRNTINTLEPKRREEIEKRLTTKFNKSSRRGQKLSILSELAEIEAKEKVLNTVQTSKMAARLSNYWDPIESNEPGVTIRRTSKSLQLTRAREKANNKRVNHTNDAIKTGQMIQRLWNMPK